MNEQQLAIEQELLNLKTHCLNPQVGDVDDEDFMDTMVIVIEGLEKAFRHHFSGKTGETFSPKSNEPWD